MSKIMVKLTGNNSEETISIFPWIPETKPQAEKMAYEFMQQLPDECSLSLDLSKPWTWAPSTSEFMKVNLKKDIMITAFLMAWNEDVSQRKRAGSPHSTLEWTV